MDEINASSKKIADIIGVIDGIAFQTNILALNAAVEAARAGEQGRGFAVVAGEVRNLAQRSAEAAKEIKGLIGASVDKVESGSALVAEAGRTMQEIVSSVQRVTDIIGEITAAATSRATASARSTRRDADRPDDAAERRAGGGEAAAAAESLKDQAGACRRRSACSGSSRSSRRPAVDGAPDPRPLSYKHRLAAMHGSIPVPPSSIAAKLRLRAVGHCGVVALPARWCPMLVWRTTCR